MEVWRRSGSDMDHEWEDPNMNEAQEEAQEERTHVQHAVRGHRTRKHQNGVMTTTWNSVVTE